MKKRQFLAWVGSRATYGKPHEKTGKLDMYGELYSFDSRKERDLFCDQFNHRFNCYPIPTNKKQVKTLFFAGHTQAQFENHLKYITLMQGV